ncbi:Fe-S-containing hydro-lyase [bacterium]|nr:Fe-S-containing hydro-lyase [bacterium]
MEITSPLTLEKCLKLKAGDKVYLTGTIYTARDQAHKRIVETLQKGEIPPFPLENSIIFYVGPTPPKPHEAIGSAGPTTSYRMDSYTPYLLDRGLKGMIGKGERGQDVINSIIKNKAVYFLAVGGAGALLSSSILDAEVIAYPDLGPEAVFKLQVEKFPCYVAIDCDGGTLFNT